MRVCLDGNQNTISTEVRVILLDINDNKPELPIPDGEFWTVSEGEVEVKMPQFIIFLHNTSSITGKRT